jgi:hypothetical protein
VPSANEEVFINLNGTINEPDVESLIQAKQLLANIEAMIEVAKAFICEKAIQTLYETMAL